MEIGTRGDPSPLSTGSVGIAGALNREIGAAAHPLKKPRRGPPPVRRTQIKNSNKNKRCGGAAGMTPSFSGVVPACQKKHAVHNKHKAERGGHLNSCLRRS